MLKSFLRSRPSGRFFMKYLPTKKECLAILLYHKQGNRDGAIAIFATKLPEEYIEQEYQSLIEEVQRIYSQKN